MTTDVSSDADNPPAANLHDHLKSLLVGVRERLGVTPIEQILTEDDYGDDIDSLPQRFLTKDGETKSPPLVRLAFEVAFRDLLFALLVSKPGNEDEFLSSIAVLLDLTFLITKHSLGDIRLFYEMVEEFFDSQPINVLKNFFRYLEVRVNTINIDMSGERNRGPILLRLCNTLLRRLSKAEDTIFAGRILIYLSQSFPLCERSGMNLKGEFHTDNVTEYDREVGQLVKKEESAAPSATPVDSDEAMTDATQPDSQLALPTDLKGSPKKEKEEEIDLDTLYPIFWSLQSYFSDPSKLFESEAAFAEFQKGLELTLQKFKQIGASTAKSGDHDIKSLHPPTPSMTSAVPASSKSKSITTTNTESTSTFNPKYLTSPTLFPLEITDLTFRRHILVQAIILLDYLLTLTPSSKEFYASHPQLYPRLSTLTLGTLPPPLETWCTSMKTQITQYLCPDRDGSLFMRTIETILHRDRNWTRWKMKGGKSFERPPISRTDLDLVIYNAKAATAPMQRYQHTMGTPALSRLWRESSPGLNGLKGRIRSTLPKPEDYAPKIQADLLEIQAPFSDEDFEAAVEAKGIKMWRAMRLASSRSYSLFNRIEDKFADWRAKELKRLKLKAEEEGTEYRGMGEEKVEERDDLKALLELEQEEVERRQKAREDRERRIKEGTPIKEEEGNKGDVLSPRKRHLDVEDEGGRKRLRSMTPAAEVEMGEAGKVEEGEREGQMEE
ncbi:hypothetical protein BJ508DRAFT_417474 [Ascobolus immersus RN42]|uniref:Nuclear matrix protein n=1 Tax=Ascobolus immersus RN42 TaxID=1160509 RepID=A0A3N4HSK8_ASCIM|nr:hypothetical protein BJ508DRAFT_417474 [Ascobolus immersus RN42]